MCLASIIKVIFVPRATMMSWSMTMKRPNLFLAIPKSQYSKKVSSCIIFPFVLSSLCNKYISVQIFFLLLIFFSFLTLSMCHRSSLRWSRDEDWSSEASPVREASADALNTSWPEKIHQVPSTLSYLLCSF